MNLTDLIGNTPLAKLSRVNPNANTTLYAKLEGNNPAGSVKDRAAYWMVKNAVARGELAPGMKLIEPTSGNTGIALAMAACLFGFEIELVMPASATRERVLSMQAYGATVTLTAADKSMEGAIDYAREKIASDGYVMLNQFGNPDNPLAHYESTGPEIWRDTKGEVTHFVSSMGTTGTIMGVSRFLKEKNSAITIVGCQPTDGSRIPGIRRWPEAYLPTIYDPAQVDQVVDLSQDEATTMTRRLAREEGICCGMSGGGAVHAAVDLCTQLTAGVVVAVIPDRGDRYLSSDLFGTQ